MERIRYRNKRVCAAVQIGIVALLHVHGLLVAGRMCVDLSAHRISRTRHQLVWRGTKEFADTLFLHVRHINTGNYVAAQVCQDVFFCNAVYGIRQVKMFVALDV